ncbi:MLO-LIKE PROTEIN 1 [Salix viminalis]|uniref:MLO-LIKE PROTEIN 1 n=1 Tax=Salix viminalis TaxID=40686 RepID=A0A9Q0U7P0_SALVM|nr:MLO-LIKE PROTEIN 1 [Salix viminalis]
MYFNKKRRRYLIQALYKIKSELMLLGFISLLLTVLEKPVANICIPKSAGETFLPCGSVDSGAWDEEEAKCAEQGKASLLSREGMKQLQYLIFVLASFHCVSSIFTFGLGMAKMRRWESWEADTRTLDYQFSTDPRRFQFSHQTSFGKRHLRYWNENSVLRWPLLDLDVFYIFHILQCTDYYWLPFIPLVNSFQLAFFTWTWYQFGFRSCFHRQTEDIVITLVTGMLVHFLCGYVTLPLYALVTQMGSSMRKAVFTENVAEGLKRWRKRARKNPKTSYSARPSVDVSVDTSLSLDSSPSFILNTSYSVDPNCPLDHVSIEMIEEAKHNDEQPQEKKENGSFRGFNVSNATRTMEKQSGL